ncbi:RNA-binding domain-containing protein [Mytilinidion resinicola]|uniref:RNA-binding domain-containing protein n=1 Tax=Mytilinidion resinicola TaxID=574789 RepID=A0A6A6Z3S1_9PEZI|nr:RNA-binding domain-containing protein [Mytilinidion resinicola]KAF2815801.1 RNA-binding domain-containing protein [Mytilinidion resinicola]
MNFQNQENTRARASTNWRRRDAGGTPSAFQPRNAQNNHEGADPGSAQATEPLRQGFRDLGRPSASPSQSQSPTDDRTAQAIADGRRIYVGNLLYHAKTEDVEALFGDGDYTIDRIVMSLDPFTGRNPSYCFVELANKEQADWAMERLNGRKLLGRPVKIKPCIPRRADRQPPSGPPSTRNTLPDRWERDDAQSHWVGAGMPGRRLFVGNLRKPRSQADSNAEIAQLFAGFAVEAISKVISGSSGDTYYAFVDLATKEEAETAARAVDGTTTSWGTIKVNKARQDHAWKVHERESFDRSREGVKLP